MCRICGGQFTFQAVDRSIGEVQVYDDFREEDLKRVFGITREELADFTGHYKNAIEQLKIIDGGDDDETPVSIDIEYELETVKQVEVNYRYLVSLLQAHMDEEAAPVTSEEDARIVKYIEAYKRSNPQVGLILESLWLELRLNPEPYRGKDAQTVIDERIREILDRLIEKFAKTWSVNKSELRAYALTTPSSEIVADKVNTGMGDFKAFQDAGGTLSRLKYVRGLRDAVVKFILDEVKPLQKF